jgi:c-di-GMP-binding flagellar brake protein YcgR
MLKRLRRLLGDRRQFKRLEAQRNARLVFSVTLGEYTASRTMPLEGYTLNISEAGMALIVPTIRLGSLYLTAAASLRIVILDLPTGEVEIEATPVRYKNLGEGKGYLIGVRIAQISDEHRARLVQYLNTLPS